MAYQYHDTASTLPLPPGLGEVGCWRLLLALIGSLDSAAFSFDELAARGILVPPSTGARVAGRLK